MQCSEDIYDNGRLGEDYGQPFAIPSPTSGGGSISIHELHLTEGDDINNEEVEEFFPLFDEEEEEGEPLRRQTRRMTMDKILEVAESLKTQGEGRTVVQRPRIVRRLVDEKEPEEPQIQEAGEEREAAEGNLANGKGSVLSTPKRSRPANNGVVITDTSEPASPLPSERNEGSDTEEEELRWNRTSRRQQGRRVASPSTMYSLQHVTLTQAMLKQMLEFDDPKWQEVVHQRVISQKRLKAGKMLHQPSLEKIEMKRGSPPTLSASDLNDC